MHKGGGRLLPPFLSLSALLHRVSELDRISQGWTSPLTTPSEALSRVEYSGRRKGGKDPCSVMVNLEAL